MSCNGYYVAMTIRILPVPQGIGKKPMANQDDVGTDGVMSSPKALPKSSPVLSRCYTNIKLLQLGMASWCAAASPV
jgi:hypothetical protein